MCVDGANMLRTQGRTLRHGGVIISKHEFMCSVCNNKRDPWYNLFGEAGHLESSNHRNRAPAVPSQPTEAEANIWTETFHKADETLQKEVLEERPGAKPGRGVQEASPSKKPRVEHPPRQTEPERQRQPQPQITVSENPLLQSVILYYSIV